MEESGEAIKIWKALLPSIRAEIKRQTKNCVRAKKMNVTSSPNVQTGTIGVQEAFSDQEFNIPYANTLYNVPEGTGIWTYWFWGDASTLIAMHGGSGKSTFGGMGNVLPITATELSALSVSQLSDLSAAGTSLLQVENNETVVLLSLRSDGSTQFLGSTQPTNNLLDNADFTNPVNQRNASSIIGGVYGIDRWSGTSSNVNVSIASGYLQFAVPATNYYNLIWQKFELGTFEGKTLTLAVCDTNGTWYAGTAVFPEAGNAQTVFSASNGIHLSFDARYGYDGIRFGVSYLATAPVQIQKVMLLQGSYTTQMLPHFVSPNFEEELEKCQYYFIPPGNSGWGVTQVTQSGYIMILIASKAMRTRPSLMPGENSLSLYINSQWVEIDATLGSITSSGNNIYLQGRTSTWTQTSDLPNDSIVLARYLPGLSAEY